MSCRLETISPLCCGVEHIQDWEPISFGEDINYFNCTGTLVPQSCQLVTQDDGCYRQGCYTVGYNAISSKIVPIGIVIMSIFMLQLLPLLRLFWSGFLLKFLIKNKFQKSPLLAVILYGLKS